MERRTGGQEVGNRMEGRPGESWKQEQKGRAEDKVGNWREGEDSSPDRRKQRGRKWRAGRRQEGRGGQEDRQKQSRMEGRIGGQMKRDRNGREDRWTDRKTGMNEIP